MTSPRIRKQLQRCESWPQLFPREQWEIYKAVIAEARVRAIPFAVGGGLSAMTYAGLWRNTKDIDLYILPRDRERMIKLVTDLGLRDYYEKQGYDRNWIYRSYTGDTIVDLMWAMANQRSQVTESWLEGPEIEVDGEGFRLLAPDKSLWTKLYVLQRDRTDWPDALNVLHGVGPELDWLSILRELGEDRPLLAGLISVFGWLCPASAAELPDWLWAELGLQRSQNQMGNDCNSRAELLDSRPWFSGSEVNRAAPGCE
jgi:hypothetical protein